MTRGDNLKNAIRDTSAKPRLRPGSPVCQCADCGCFFSGPSVFDKHLNGQGNANPACKSVRQMQAAGMLQNEHGVWLYGISAKKLREQAA